MEHLDDGSFGIIGNVPEWFVQFYPDVASKKDKLRLGRSSFSRKLSARRWRFLDRKWSRIRTEIGAVEWNWQIRQRMPSWSLSSLFEKQENIMISLLKMPITKNNQLYNTPGKPASYYHFLKIQKQETLIHCIIHDLTGQITELITVLSSFLSKYDTPKEEYLENGKKQSKKQAMLIETFWMHSLLR